MKCLAALLSLVVLATPVLGRNLSADEPEGGPRDACNLTSVAVDWNFTAGPQGFTTTACDEGAAAVWQYGHTYQVPGSPGYVWGTVLNGNYPDDGGGGLVTPYLYVTAESCLLEIEHFMEAESGVDGGNVSVRVSGGPNLVLLPIGGYTTDELSPGGTYTNCVEGEPGWTGHTAPQWRTDCFDLSSLIGGEVQLEFDFGSDAAVNYRGWFISRIRVGASGPPVAACCFSGECSQLTEAECAYQGGVWYPDIPDCDPSACPPGARLRIGNIIDAETWHDYVGPTGRVIHLSVDLPRSEFPVVNEVRFVYSINDGAQWYAIGGDQDGGEPILDTYGTSQPAGDGWSVDWVVPVIAPPPPSIRFAANVYTPSKSVVRFESPAVEYDALPPERVNVDIEDIVVVSDDTLGVAVDPDGVQIEQIYVYRYPTGDYFHKGVPGIDQHLHSPTSCAPAASGQSLEYYAADGDPEITGGLSSEELLLHLATIMETNVDTVGTRLSSWVNGTREWIQGRGNDYTVQTYRHFTESGTSTWTRDDWIRIRDSLQRCNNVLMGLYWQSGGGHAVTLNGISHTMQGGRFELEFRDPWTGTLQYADIDTATGMLYGVSGAGGGGTAFLGSSLIVARRELQVSWGYPGELVYAGPLPAGPYHIVRVGLPDLAHYLVQIIVVNDLGHARTITGMVRRILPTGVEEETLTPTSARFGFCTPNPFFHETQIAYTLPAGIQASVDVYDLGGRRVRRLFAGVAEPGENIAVWNGRDDRGQGLPSGVYYLRLTSGAQRIVRKVTLLR